MQGGTFSLVPSFFLCILILNMWVVELQSSNESTTITTTTEEAPITVVKTTFPDISSYDWDVWCKLQANGYSCVNDGGVPMFYYDTKMEDCKTFQFGKCSDFSKNYFSTLSDCHDSCREAGRAFVVHNFTPNIYCLFQPDFGQCDDYKQMFYYDMTSHQCQGFSFSGCGGNQNRFKDIHLCETVCGGAVDHPHHTTPGLVVKL